MRGRDVRRVLGAGGPLHGRLVVVFLAPGSGAESVVVGRRVGGAVDRNRARRVLRAALHEVRPRMEDGSDVVVVARPVIRGAKTQDVVADMVELLGGGALRS